jgi:O-antigen/teichoic acid export membrane protein
MGQLTTIALHARRLNIKGVSRHALKKTAIRYKNFALYNAPAALLNTTAAGLPVFYLSKILKKEDVGFYGLVERSIGAPISLVSYSISQVLLEDIASRHKQELPIRGNLVKLVITLSLIGIVPFTILFFFSENIFSFIFGAAWAEAGRYASILAVAFFMRFVVSPLSMVLISTNNLKVLVGWQTMHFFTTLGVVLFSMHAQEATRFLVALAVNDVLMYGLYLFLILRVVRA